MNDWQRVFTLATTVYALALVCTHEAIYFLMALQPAFVRLRILLHLFS
jgi:hypothetical protein